MKRAGYFCFLLFAFTSCSSTKEEELADKTCACFEPIAAIEEEMSDEYRTDIYPVIEKLRPILYKKRFVIPVIQQGINDAHNYQANIAEKSMAQKSYALAKNLLLWEIDCIHHLDAVHASEILSIVSFDELTSDDLYVLDQVRKQLEEHYHNRYKMLQNELDETLAEKFNALGTEEFKARYGNQPSYDTPQMEYFICVDELIQQYILDGGNATYDELREKFDNECESANIFL